MIDINAMKAVDSVCGIAGAPLLYAGYIQLSPQLPKGSTASPNDVPPPLSLVSLCLLACGQVVACPRDQQGSCGNGRQIGSLGS